MHSVCDASLVTASGDHYDNAHSNAIKLGRQSISFASPSCKSVKLPLGGLMHHSTGRRHTVQRARRLTNRLLVGSTLVLIVGQAALAQQHAGQYEQVDIEFGAQLYASHCITCHGENGDLQPAINLRSGQFPHANNDRELTDVIRDGIAGTAMAANNYNDSELAALVAYVRNIGTVNLDSIAIGDAARGRAIYEGKGECRSCHRIAGVGPRIAPDLTNIGATRTAATLQRVLVDPTEALVPINRQVRIITNDGKVISGRRLNEDTFTVQLIDDQQKLVSLEKSRLREFSITTSSAMPSYATTLSDSERADLLAYLLSLTGVDE